MQAEQLLHTITQQRLVMAQAREQYGAVLAPDFLVMDYLRTDEMGLSRILADLLNPHGSHHQGSLFLKRFLEKIFGHESSETHWAAGLSQAVKFRVGVEEVCTASQTLRRMDILIEWENTQGQHYALCIENKPYAGDQANQIIDYLNELKGRQYQHYHVLYLNGYGSDPLAYSISPELAEHYRSNSQLSTLEYGELIGWLKNCRMDCRSDRVANFLREIEKFIQRVFMGERDMDESNKIKEIIQQDSRSLVSAFEISKQLQNVQDQLIDQFQRQLEVIFEKQGYKASGKLSREKYSTVRLENEDSFYPNYDFALSFDMSNYGYPIVGLVSATEETINKEFANKVFNLLRGISFNSNVPKKSTWWAYFVLLGRHDAIQAPYWWHWTQDPQPWSKILDGTLAEEIAEYISKLDSVLRQKLP